MNVKRAGFKPALHFVEKLILGRRGRRPLFPLNFLNRTRMQQTENHLFYQVTEQHVLLCVLSFH